MSIKGRAVERNRRPFASPVSLGFLDIYYIGDASKEVTDVHQTQ